jgi:two-component system sensor histidine kinase MprB
MSFRARIALISATAVAIAIALAALITYTTTRHELLAEVDGSLQQRLDTLQEIEDLPALITALRSDGDSEAFGHGTSGFDKIFYQFNPEGSTTLVHTYPVEGGLPIGAQEQAVYDGQVASVLRTVPGVTGDNLRMLTATIPTGVVQIARSLAEVDSSLHGLAAVLKMAAVVGVLIAAAIGYVVARDAARPIRQLAQAAEHVAMTQELASRIDVNRADEVGRLAESFNAMLAALENSREQQRRLVHDAGHELRTPLTAIRTNIEMLTRMDNIPAEDRRQMIDDVDNEIQELSGLVTELVDLAAEPPTASEATEPVNLGEIVDRVAEKFRRRTGHTIEVVTDESVVCGRSATLERAVSNLVDNALKWSPLDQPVEVKVAGGTVTVTDNGPGIDAEDRPFVFNRFYRATAARSTPGSGLGLSIVAKVAEEHGGRVFVGDTVAGAVVGFTVPVLGEDEDAGAGREPETV